MANPSLQSPTNPHFFQPLLPGFDTHLTIPVAFFSKHIEGKFEQKTAILRSDVSEQIWEVKVDGRRFTQGWKYFATAHDLRIGDIIIFKHEGDMVFNVTPFGPSCCEIQYAQSHTIKEEDDIGNENQHNIRNVMRKKKLKLKTEPKSSLSFDYCFVAEVTAANLQSDKLRLPMIAASSKAVNRGCHKMIVVNEEGKSWNFDLSFKESDRSYYIGGGWKIFCRENKRKIGDLIPFNLVGDGRSSPMLCICPEEECSELMSKYMSGERGKKKIKRLPRWEASSSSRKNRFVTISLTDYNFRSSKLVLPLGFTMINGIYKHDKIILMDKHGEKLVTSFVKDGSKYGKRGLGKGWKVFCEANDIEIGQRFVLELIWEDATPVLNWILEFTFSVSMMVRVNSKSVLNEVHENIPVAFFSKHIEGRNEYKSAKLRSDASDTTWEVKFDGRRLTGGWTEFATAHDLRIGDVVVFRKEGDLVFHVTALGPSCCEIEYTSSHNIDDDSDDHQDKDNTAPEIRPMKERAKKNTRIKEEDSSSDNSCFVANVSVSSLRQDKLYIPVSFVRSNGLSKTYGKIVLLNETGRSWNLTLGHYKSGANSYIRYGWRRFCSDNGIKGGRFTFKLVQNSETPIIRLYQAEHRYEVDLHSYLVGSLTPSSLRDDTLNLPRDFVNSNGLKERCEMVLKNENGGTWELVLRHNKANNTTVISGGWRRFCQVNGIKARDPFRFKLVGTGDKPVLRLCPAETNRDTRRQVDCSEGTDVHSLSTSSSSGEETSETEESEDTSRDDISVNDESEEESIEDKSSLRESLNVEKWKYWSRAGASFSSSQNRFVTLTITPYSIKSNKMKLPLHFTKVNGINKAGTIMLMGQDGVSWMVHLAQENSRGRMRLGRDWKGFCEVHGVKIGDSFVLELIREKDARPVLKFYTKVRCV
ncbi:unnamed protein product [Thlaspi arvense]|uniref:TF-B3 domain-containing protein n=1 Tax=Thlaspi arvense TaxID=13288 RepID=A0AAU9T2F6_THLAR|nr:unnamed protein product [Thlaspi arvense]